MVSNYIILSIFLILKAKILQISDIHKYDQILFEIAANKKLGGFSIGRLLNI